ncbi:DUF2971 domain-containing protein [Flavobacterium sp. 7A]|uniref:DUF2971 domain-containing protein n=1 Tax=Flavobacterium sp. 7A TaxID=2940571 RepID=UPI0022269D48|nr:DUF2971 domain-containing protein [Flavobacterium sp. 7A]MCW2119504.1 hypothetical protein [Flavobacterium sp. 7A]
MGVEWKFALLCLFINSNSKTINLFNYFSVFIKTSNIDMQDNERIFSDFENVDKFKREVLNPILPKAKFSSCFMQSTPGVPADDFSGQLSPIHLLKGSVYEYKGDNSFIHYSSLFGLKAILESGFLRMSEFGNLMDKKELNFASTIFEDNNSLFRIDEDTITVLKENIFCLSLCESNEETKRNDFMWEVYGDKGKGAIIELKLTKKDPEFFIQGKVLYGNEKLNSIREIKNLTEKFAAENNNFIPNNFAEFLIELQAFHKSKRYSIENEVRFLMKENKQQYDEHKLETIYRDINSNQEVKYFNKLFLKGRHPYLNSDQTKNNRKVLDEFPQVEIKRVILGFNISIENKVDIYTLLNKIKVQHNYDFEISQINDDKEIFPMR